MLSPENGKEVCILDLMNFLTLAAKTEGTSGREGHERTRLQPYFEAVAEDIQETALGALIGRVGHEGPKVMISAHMDEIGMTVRLIEKDGSIRLRSVGGVDPRILPASEVTVHTAEGPLFGVVGAKPPHLLTPEEAGRASTMDDMYVDVGLKAEDVRKRVRIGDVVTLVGDVIRLGDDLICGKTMDDRCGVAAMLLCAEELKKNRTPAQVYITASTQEEVGAFGAATAARKIAPDVAIAIDVCHASGAGASPARSMPITKVGLTCGPVIHPALLKIAKEVAQANGIDVQVQASGRGTATDADAIQPLLSGIPCLLISIPLRYMHTTVELISEESVRQAGKLMSLFISQLARRWEEIEWY